MPIFGAPVGGSFLKHELSHIPLIQLAEERRLFYVALTRTKNRVYIVAPEQHPSKFVTELINDFKNVKVNGKIDEEDSNNPADTKRCPSKDNFETVGDKNLSFLDEALDRYGIVRKDVAAKLGIGYTALYFWFRHDDVFISYIYKIAEQNELKVVIKIDYSAFTRILPKHTFSLRKTRKV